MKRVATTVLECTLEPPVSRGFEKTGIHWHGLGDSRDLLALDLRGAPDAALLTDVLARCGHDGTGAPLTADPLLDLTVGERVLALVKAAEAEGWRGIEVAFVCPKAGCGAEIAIDLAPTEIEELAAGQDDIPVAVTLADGLLRLRRPTGRDQQVWAERHYASRNEAMTDMIDRLRLDGPRRAFSDSELALIEAELDACDPLVCCAVEVCCPACGGFSVREVDLAGILLRRLHQAQVALLESIHRLAHDYHWSEAEIVALPRWRRDHYLSLLEREGIL